ncbi:hypothetical protein BJ742DRAFT_793637 [Cladochytrium replicatum]|nr:hypothetical protein BJ742DRAFT_793637 [Cladochytrium replicatum]
MSSTPQAPSFAALDGSIAIPVRERLIRTSKFASTIHAASPQPLAPSTARRQASAKQLTASRPATTTKIGTMSSKLGPNNESTNYRSEPVSRVQQNKVPSVISNKASALRVASLEKRKPSPYFTTAMATLSRENRGSSSLVRKVKRLDPEPSHLPMSKSTTFRSISTVRPQGAKPTVGPKVESRQLTRIAGPARAKKALSPPQQEEADFEFNNASLAAILGSSKADELDGQEDALTRRRGDEPADHGRKSMAQLRMSIVQARRNTELHMKRASIYAGAMRVIKKRPVDDHAYADDMASSSYGQYEFADRADPSHARLQRGVDEYFTRQNVPPSTEAPSTVSVFYSPDRTLQKSTAQSLTTTDGVSRQLDFGGASASSRYVVSHSERIMYTGESGVPVMAAAAEPSAARSRTLPPPLAIGNGATESDSISIADISPAPKIDMPNVQESSSSLKPSRTESDSSWRSIVGIQDVPASDNVVLGRISDSATTDIDEDEEERIRKEIDDLENFEKQLMREIELLEGMQKQV